MHALDSALLNDFQRDFPLVPRPFAAIGARLGATEAEVIARYRALTAARMVSRIGVVFRPNAAGASTLAALAVPAQRLEAVAAFVSAQPEVNHNYEREHRFNLWFVLTAASQTALAQAIRRIERATGLAVLSLALEEEYHIDLGFDLRTLAAPRAPARPRATVPPSDRPLMAAIERGIPLVPEPFEAIGRAAGMSETAVRATLERWLASGAARRFGVVVRHRSLGFAANAMVVWDVPDAEADEAGARLARAHGVTLAYRRARRLPEWPYNLFCMLHGRDREAVRARIGELRQEAGLAAMPHEILFSRRCFKQRGAWYATAAEAAHG
jgi:DNA-binding Lrp family transcriptional regulator